MILNWSTTIRRRLAHVLVCVSVVLWCHAADSTAVRSYIPELHGTFRGVYELSTVGGGNRFAVQNARVMINGEVFTFLDYMAQVDLCDNGRIVFLDAYARVKPARGLYVYMGQMRVPFSVQSSRTPAQYRFVDASLPGQFGNLRSVGVKAGYDFGIEGLYAEGGIFNATDKADHNTWNSALTYGIKLSYSRSGWRPELAFMSRQPGGKGHGVRVNQWNASLAWVCGGLTLEADYIWRLYAGTSMHSSSVWGIIADYGWPVKWRMANRLSVQARFDGLTQASSAFLNADGSISADMPARRRITFGVTTSYIYKKVHFDFRINYEQYFYSKDVENITAANNNKLAAGAVLYF